ncbi:MAG: DNA-3-methyladenine glycosylase [Verrucomicrobia bacterium]|nr:DNA-3-methyladenine glycosylase [Verrucomicrobiota bacterium]
MGRIIKAKELQAKKTVALARGLLGKHLVRRHADGRIDARMIVETEAYDGERDLACHARVGRTKRTEVMYAAGGVWYVYLCYGIHEMLNLVVGPEGWPAAVLVRGVEGAIGPGRVTKALGIGRALNGTAATEDAGGIDGTGPGLWVEDRGVKIPRGAVTATPRIGVDYAGLEWAGKPWRFVLAKDFVAALAIRAQREKAGVK